MERDSPRGKGCRQILTSTPRPAQSSLVVELKACPSAVQHQDMKPLKINNVIPQDYAMHVCMNEGMRAHLKACKKCVCFVGMYTSINICKFIDTNKHSPIHMRTCKHNTLIEILINLEIRRHIQTFHRGFIFKEFSFKLANLNLTNMQL